MTESATAVFLRPLWVHQRLLSFLRTPLSEFCFYPFPGEERGRKLWWQLEAPTDPCGGLFQTGCLSTTWPLFLLWRFDFWLLPSGITFQLPHPRSSPNVHLFIRFYMKCDQHFILYSFYSPFINSSWPGKESHRTLPPGHVFILSTHPYWWGEFFQKNGTDFENHCG